MTWDTTAGEWRETEGGEATAAAPPATSRPSGNWPAFVAPDGSVVDSAGLESEAMELIPLPEDATKAAQFETLARSLNSFPSRRTLASLAVHASCHHVCKQLPPASVDMFAFDPPFGVGDRRFDDTPFEEKQWTDLMQSLWQTLRPGGRILIFCNSKLRHELEKWLQVHETAGIGQSELHWYAEGAGGCNLDRMPPASENILVLWKKDGDRERKRYFPNQVRPPPTHLPCLAEAVRDVAPRNLTWHARRHRVDRKGQPSTFREITPTGSTPSISSPWLSCAT